MPKFKPNPDGMKPSGFKMKGWSGYQGSPIKKGLGDIKIVQDLKKAGQQIKEDFGRGGKVYKEIKEDVKKLKSKLGLKEKEKEGTTQEVGPENMTKKQRDFHTKIMKKGRHDWDPTTGSYKLKEEGGAESEIVSDEDRASVVDPGDLVETNPWTSGSGNDPWEYKKVDGGYQTRKGPNGDIINITDPKSKAYQAIGEKIFDVESKTYGGNIDLESTIPEDVLFHNPDITYKEYMAGDYHLGNPKNSWRQKHEE